MTLNATENWVISGQSRPLFNKNWETYKGFRDALLKINENPALFERELLGQVTLAELQPHYDGKTSIAIGYGVDLLVRLNNEVDGYLTGAHLPKLTQADGVVLDLARALFFGYRVLRNDDASVADRHLYLDGYAEGMNQGRDTPIITFPPNATPQTK